MNDESAVASWIIKSGKLGKSTVYKWLDVVLARFRDASRYIARSDTHFEVSPVIHPEPEVTNTSEPRDPVIETIESTVQPASGDPSQAEPTPSGSKTDLERRPLREIDDGPTLRAVEIMRLHGSTASAQRRRALRRSSVHPVTVPCTEASRTTACMERTRSSGPNAPPSGASDRSQCSATPGA